MSSTAQDLAKNSIKIGISYPLLLRRERQTKLDRHPLKGHFFWEVYQPQKTFLSRSFIFDGTAFTDLQFRFNPNRGLLQVIQGCGINNQGKIVSTVQAGISYGSVEGFLATSLAGSGGQ